MSKSLSIKMLILSTLVTITTAFTYAQDCGSNSKNPRVRINHDGGNADIFYDGKQIYSDVQFSLDRMGDKGLNCQDISISKHTVAMRYGHNNDLLLVFAFEYDSKDNLTGIYRHFWRIQDGKHIEIAISEWEDVFVTYGNNHDIRQRLTFDYKSKSWILCEQNRKTHEFIPINHLARKVETNKVYSK